MLLSACTSNGGKAAWEICHYTDEFDNPTNSPYVTQQLIGTYESVTDDVGTGKLTGEISIERIGLEGSTTFGWNDYIIITLYTDGNKVSRGNYKISFLEETGNIIREEGRYYGTPTDKGGTICLSSLVSEESEGEIVAALRNNTKLAVVVTGEDNKYKFDISCEGFGAAFDSADWVKLSTEEAAQRVLDTLSF